MDKGRSLLVEPGFDANHLRALLAVRVCEELGPGGWGQGGRLFPPGKSLNSGCRTPYSNPAFALAINLNR
jgi:hypothetical protein